MGFFFIRLKMTLQMKNVRTGKIAVFDADLIESGRWEKYVPPQIKPVAKAKTFKASASLAVGTPVVEHTASTTE